MRPRALALAALAALLTAGACSPTQPDPPALPTASAGCTVTGDHNSVNCGNGDQTVTNPQPSPAPSPGGAALPVGSAIKVGAFGQTCPAGVQVPSDGHALKLTCQEAVTCTPKGPTGELLPPEVTGVKPDFFGVKAGDSVVRANPWEDEFFNLNLVGKAEGEFDLQCVVKGLPSDLWHGRVYKADAAGLRVELTSHVVYSEGLR